MRIRKFLEAFYRCGRLKEFSAENSKSCARILVDPDQGILTEFLPLWRRYVLSESFCVVTLFLLQHMSIPDIYYFQNTPEVTSVSEVTKYPFLQFDCIIDYIIDYFCTEPLKPVVLHTPL